MTSPNATRAEIRRKEREKRGRDNKINRLAELRDAAIEASDAYALACARVHVLSKELDSAERRNDEEKFVELVQQLKSAVAEKFVREKAEIRLNASLARLVAKLAVDRVKWEQSQGVQNV